MTTVAAQPAAERPALTGSSTASARVLVVDDEAINRSTLSHLLRHHGFEVIEAADGREAIAAVLTEPLDLVLLDISMPGFDGFQVTRVIRQTRSKAELPVIMVTSNDDRDPVVMAFRSGASDYITKPVDPAIALARIHSQLNLVRAHTAMRESEERYALAAAGANDGLWDWNIRTGSIYYSKRWKSMVGVSAEDDADRLSVWFDRIHNEDLNRFQQDLSKHLRGESEHFETELRIRRASQLSDHETGPGDGGNYRWMLCRGLAVRDAVGKAIRIAGSLTDITEGKVADALTGLPNRLLFVDRVQRCVEQMKRNAGRCFAVLYLDVNDFKLINDSYGHEAGDRFLIELARRLERGVRTCDSVVARLGGDEFAVLLENLDSEHQATIVAQRILRDMEPPFQLGDRELLVRGSIGIAVASDRCETAEQLIREADVAMYFAKEHAHVTHKLFDPEMKEEAAARLEMGSELQAAVERGELRTHFQPIIDLKEGRTAGFEALLRWDSPQFGMVAPSEFIPLAESNGAILAIGQHVLNTACAAAARFRSDCGRPILMSVNVSPRQLADESLAEVVATAIHEHGLPPDCLKLEVTEGTVMQDPDSSIKLLSRLQKLGVAIGLDDFGTGYSSLAYLHEMPLSVLKIDRSFVSRMLESDSNGAIVETIVRLADSLRLDVVAEGVETKAQMARLRELGCRYAQGYLFAKPVCEADAQRLTERRWDVSGS